MKIEDQSAIDVVKHMAKQLGVDVEESINECCVRIPDTLGSGYVKSYQFDFGIGVVETDYLLTKELEFAVEPTTFQPLKIIFNRQEPFYQKLSSEKDYKEIKHLENIIVSASLKDPQFFKIPEKKPICIFSIEINRKIFEEKIKEFIPDLNKDLIEIFRDVNGINSFFYKGYYSLEIGNFMDEFCDCDLTGFMRQVYLEGKVYEIISHQLKQYLDDLNEPDKRIIFRKSTVDNIEKAVEIIKTEIEAVGNIKELAKKVGLNQNTLQNGFQLLYKKSVNEYIKNYRIEKAKELIEQTDLNITEITYKVGINSRSYFSKLFKEKYGLSPKKFLTQIRSKDSDFKSA